MAEHRTRVGSLDALRGVAILLVLGFHFGTHWAALYPYGDRWQGNPLLSQGWLGVELFFMISGYVIYLTLQRTASLPLFLARRWVRLAPALLFVSLALYATSGWFPERPQGPVAAINLLPSLLFSEQLAGWLAGQPVGSVEGAFWSLYVECQFYLLIGALHYLLSRRHDWRAFYALTAALCLLAWLSKADLTGDFSMARVTQGFFLPLAMGWFLIGIMAFRLQRGESGWLPLLGAVVLTLGMPGATPPWPGSMALKMTGKLVVVAIFLGAVLAPPRWLANRCLLFFGFVSYPLYLLHENLGVALIVRWGRDWPELPHALLPLLAVAVTTALAWLLARHIEPWLQRPLLRWVK